MNYVNKSYLIRSIVTDDFAYFQEVFTALKN